MTPRLDARQLASMEKRLAAFPAAIEKAMENHLKAQATTLCTEYARATGPGKGLGEKPILDYQKRVAAQIHQLFPSAERPYAVAALIQRRSPKLAAGYLRAIKQNKPVQARRYLREAGLKVDSIDPAAHAAARTATGGGVPRDAQPIAIVNAAQLRPYIRAAQAKAGMAKAAWYQAAKAIVSRIRANVRNPDGTRRTFEVFPKLIKAVARKFPGLGGGSVTGTGLATTVTIFSNVSHGPDAADMANLALANTESSATLAKSVATTLAYLSKKFFP